VPASSCGFRLKDFELHIQYGTEVQLRNLSVGLLQCSWSGIQRKVGNVALISPIRVPGLDQQLSTLVRHRSGISRPIADVETDELVA
jgi:hypothetical protein